MLASRAVGGVACAARARAQGHMHRVVVAVKATFAMAHEGEMIAAAPLPIEPEQDLEPVRSSAALVIGACAPDRTWRVTIHRHMQPLSLEALGYLEPRE